MRKNNKSQLILLAGFLLLSLAFFIYSLETSNFYIESSRDSYQFSHYIFEFCTVAQNNNGTQLDTKMGEFETSFESFCLNSGYECNITIQKLPSAPVNDSLLNYSHYNFTLDFESEDFSYKEGFIC